MATLTLTKTWINLVSTGVAVSGQTARGRPEEYEMAGTVSTFAGGRRRAITSAGVAGRYAFQLLLIPRTSVDLLNTWQGQLVQVRDNKGRCFFGVFHKVTITEYVSRTTFNVTVELTAVTADEGV